MDLQKIFEMGFGGSKLTDDLLACYRKLGPVERSIERVKRDAANEPNNAFFPELLGHILRHLERYEESVSAYEQSLAREPSRIKSHIGGADRHRRLGNVEAAIAAYSEWIAIDGSHATPFVERGELYVELENYASAP